MFASTGETKIERKKQLKNKTNLDDFVFVGLWFLKITIYGGQENTVQFRNVKGQLAKSYRKATRTAKEPSKSFSFGEAIRTFPAHQGGKLGPN